MHGSLAARSCDSCSELSGTNRPRPVRGSCHESWRARPAKAVARTVHGPCAAPFVLNVWTNRPRTCNQGRATNLSARTWHEPWTSTCTARPRDVARSLGEGPDERWTGGSRRCGQAVQRAPEAHFKWRPREGWTKRPRRLQATPEARSKKASGATSLHCHLRPTGRGTRPSLGGALRCYLGQGGLKPPFGCASRGTSRKCSLGMPPRTPGGALQAHPHAHFQGASRRTSGRRGRALQAHVHGHFQAAWAPT